MFSRPDVLLLSTWPVRRHYWTCYSDVCWGYQAIGTCFICSWYSFLVVFIYLCFLLLVSSMDITIWLIICHIQDMFYLNLYFYFGITCSRGTYLVDVLHYLRHVCFTYNRVIVFIYYKIYKSRSITFHRMVRNGYLQCFGECFCNVWPTLTKCDSILKL